ncbi:TPA: ead/Ea22-like family protein, partial [Escherichia coli]
MSKIDYQKLREIAEKTKIAGEAPVMPFDQRINALNDFMKHFSPDIALALLDERERNLQYIKSRDQENEDIALTVGKLRVELEAAEKRIAELEAEPVSNSDELPLDYLQGHKDGLEWAAQLAEANHPQTGDWLYDDPIDLARAIRKGPDMPTVQA